MAEYNNPAGRIWEVLKAVGDNNAKKIDQFGNFLGTGTEWESLLEGVQDLQREHKKLLQVVESFRENKSKYNLYMRNMDAIASSINSFNINMVNKNIAMQISPAAVVALEFIAADLPQEEPVPRDDLEELRKLCDELQREVHTSENLNKSLKEWLLDLIRLMRDAIDRYKIRGARGLRKQFHEMLGSIMDHYEEVKEVNQKESGIWRKVIKGFDLLEKASDFYGRATLALDVLRKSLPGFSSGEGLPSP